MDTPRFTLDTLGDLDEGFARILIDKAIAGVIDDIGDRPGIDTARRVTVVLELTPNINDAGGLKGVNAAVKVGTKVPGAHVTPKFLPTTMVGNQVHAHMPTDRPHRLFPGTRADEDN